MKGATKAKTAKTSARRDATTLDAKTRTALFNLATAERNGEMALALCRLDPAWERDAQPEMLMMLRRDSYARIAHQLALIVSGQASRATGTNEKAQRAWCTPRDARLLARVVSLLDATAKAEGLK